VGVIKPLEGPTSHAHSYTRRLATNSIISLKDSLERPCAGIARCLVDCVAADGGDSAQSPRFGNSSAKDDGRANRRSESEALFLKLYVSVGIFVTSAHRGNYDFMINHGTDYIIENVPGVINSDVLYWISARYF
jgi:hypothetical protein